MMEQNLQTVLFIDDHSSVYHSSLRPAAEAVGYEIYSVDNVLDGLEFIKTYTNTVCAVILDYSFPKGEIQGLEALQMIKKTDRNLPVILLTDSDSASDIDRVVECMKKGAYNYIGKRTLNPVYLFQVVDLAVREYKMLTRINSVNIFPEKKHLFFTVDATCEFGCKHSGIFGFELKSVNKARDEREAVNLERVALQWHENLLKSISIIYNDAVQLNLKYITENNVNKFFIIFTIYDQYDFMLDSTINNFQHDISPFFINSKADITHPYIFQEIRDSDYLLNANTHTEDYKYNVFFREPIKVNSKKNIGFNPVRNSKTEELSGDKPNEIFSFQTNFHYDNELFNALSNQSEYVEIDVELMPKQLTKDEIDLIRQVIKDTSVLDTENLTDDELKTFPGYLQKFVGRTNDKFIISVMLKRKTSKWLHHLKNGILSYFFGLSEDVGYYLRKPDNLLRYCSSKELNLNKLPFFYSIDNAIQIFRLPIPSINGIQGVKQQSNNFHFQPGNLTLDGILMGVKEKIDGNVEIRIDQESLAKHLYIMGQTGTGKSTMLKTMINDCLDKNYGFTVIDPHGDLFDQVLKLIPKKRKEKVYILDITDPYNSVKINPLQYDENLPQAKSLVINEMIRVFTSIYDMKVAGGPIFETYFKNGLLLLMDSKVEEKFGKGNLSDMLSLFYDSDYRKKILEICGDKSLREFFKNSEYMSGEQSFANFAPYIVSKLNKLVSDYYLAPLLNSENSINFRSLIDSGGILLVRMDKGLIGPDNSSLFGQLVLSKLILAGMSRTKTKIEERTQHYIFIDEFQNFLKSDVGSALSEVRKYGLTLILANQTLGQLDNYIIQSLLGNVGSLVFFRPGIHDYELLKYYLEPDFERGDILKLPNFNCISRLLINNIPSDPFVFQTKND